MKNTIVTSNPVRFAVRVLVAVAIASLTFAGARPAAALVVTSDCARMGLPEPGLGAGGLGVKGIWSFSSAGGYTGVLAINLQCGRVFRGRLTMSGETSDPVGGTVGSAYPAGVAFTRTRSGAFTQSYTGTLVRRLGTAGWFRKLSGTFSHNGAGAYSWSASRFN